MRDMFTNSTCFSRRTCGTQYAVYESCFCVSEDREEGSVRVCGGDLSGEHGHVAAHTASPLLLRFTECARGNVKVKWEYSAISAMFYYAMTCIRTWEK